MSLRGLGGLLLVLALSVSAQDRPADANELLARGIQLIPSKPAEAVKLLEQALRLNPELPELRYHLGIAYHSIGDEADAAMALREAVTRTPDSAAAHNYLGIVLFQMGDAKAALPEFRAAAGLAPLDPNAHFNLGEAMARTGQTNAAVEELRIAAGLAPNDAGLARLVTVVEAKLRAPEGAIPEGTIKVDVRQVLVPLVVTDREGHHVTGLTQADFKLFEDGVEQVVTAFSVEKSGLLQPETPAAVETLLTAPPSPAARPPALPAPASPAARPPALPALASPAARPPALLAPASPAARPPALPAVPRRTYLVLIDTLHTSFLNMAAARDALVKLFQQERSEDSQYVVLALGASAEMVLNVTPDPSAVVAALQSKRLQKVYLDGHAGGLKPEMERFRRGLNQTRVACDVAAVDRTQEVACASGLGRVTEQSRQIAELDRTLTTGFLRELRSVVAQLARARDRRTIVLISDGFQIEPGREALALVNAFFPPASHCLVPQGVYCPPNLQLSATRMADEFEPILKLAAAGNVTIDTIDSRGLYGQQAFDASNAGTSPVVDAAVGRVDRNMAAADGNTLAEIAAATGGTAFHDSNNLLGGLEHAFADGRDYYTIGYVSSNANYDGKFRAIAVQVRDRNAVVTAKRGYWAAPAAQ